MGQRQSSSNSGDLHRSTRAIAIGVVDQGAGRAVVNDVIVRIQCICADSESAGGQGACGRQSGENRILKLDRVIDHIKIGNRIDLTQRSKPENIVTDSARQYVGTLPAIKNIVTGSAFQLILAGVAYDNVGQIIPSAVDGGGSRQRQILYLSG